MKLKLSAVLAACLFTLQAQAITIVGTTTGAPTWWRPVAGNPPVAPLSVPGTNVNYTSLQFTVSTNGTYVFQSTATGSWDNYTFLYRNSFSTSSQLTNVLVGNDDNTSVGLSGFSYALTTGTTYYFITTGFTSGDAGAYSNSITGPGDVIPVPEPASYAMLALGLVGIVSAIRRSNARG